MPGVTPRLFFILIKYQMKSIKKGPSVKTYKLLSRSIPLSCTIKSTSKPQAPLLYFDPEKGIQRAIRYCPNQTSIFVDEQDEHAIMEHIVFEDGFLFTRENDIVLQKFIECHPEYGKKFALMDKAKDAQSELKKLDLEFEAMSKANELTGESLEMVVRGILNQDPDSMSTAEMKRDVKLYAKRNPQEFLESLDDPDIDLQAKVASMFDKGLIQERKNGREVYYNLKDNKSRMLQVPHGKDPSYMVMAYFKTNEGIEALKKLEDLL